MQVNKTLISAKDALRTNKYALSIFISRSANLICLYYKLLSFGHHLRGEVTSDTMILLTSWV